jgi:hypothetical protein
MAAQAKVTGLPPLAGASGARVCEGDLLAMSQARHRLQRDRATLIRGLLPPDPQELWLWLHRSKALAHHCWA